jgi:hypothetical protein
MSRLVMLPKRDKCEAFGHFHHYGPLAGSMRRQQEWTPIAVLSKTPEDDYLVSVRGLMADSGRLDRNSAARSPSAIR